MYQEGKPSSYFEKELGISANTIRIWQYKFNHPELNNGNKRGRQKKNLTKEDWILFYNTTRLKSKVKKKRKTYTKREK